MRYPAQKQRNGFTLVEIIVSLAIFSVVAVVALGALIKIINANNKAQTLQSAMTNLNFSLDAMSREMRVGDTFYCQTSFDGASVPNLIANHCDRGQNQLIAFKSSRTSLDGGGNPCNLIYAYWFDSSGGKLDLKKAEQRACSETLGSSGTDPFISVISPNVTLTSYETGVDFDSAHLYPNLFISMTGFAGVKESQKTYFTIQTDVAARSYH